ncbi:S-formylglutathione hydrolase FrmB [Roseivirga pacifica]|uniref:S-formylglutathione hydrolase FrmB n=1 Tax=Roseivirga pacifica TaxID=1267423 RepID=A0A1I0Q677_9BACT|nr:alpha/beta hydrolase family protein [Roseivirga pacifica]RKQ43210.1 S-formylglutathione hydrolase FrmB [Roseivirga pacifica]SEW22385.1 S-formylglutathione hydrolase FrmB [Roseivirga pacifica]
MIFLRKRLMVVLLVFQCSMLLAQQGTVDTSKSIHSEILNRDMPYSIYFPPGYEASDRPYPVLYLLHGMTGNYLDWSTKGETRSIADAVINDGAAPEMIIVMPDGLFDGFYINNYDKSIRWEDFFYEEFIPHIEKEYPILANRNNRAIAGLSMGGYGALYHGIKHKDMFNSVYAMSAAVIEREPLKKGEELNEFDKQFALKTWGPINDEGYPENFKAHSIQEMFKARDPYKAPSFGFMQGPAQTPLPSIYLDCGDDDFLIEQNTNLLHIMKGKGYPLEFRVRNGGHTWEYWRTALPIAMEFVGDKFRN